MEDKAFKWITINKLKLNLAKIQEFVVYTHKPVSNYEVEKLNRIGHAIHIISSRS